MTELFAAADVDAQVVLLPSGAHAPDAAREAHAAGACAIVAGGGDGTVNAVGSVVAGTNTVLGVLPLGTLNHFARDAGIPLDLEAAVATVVAGHIRTVDTGEVNGRTFVNNASIGIYPDIVVERERLRQLGHRKWIAFVLASARILRRYRRLVVRLAAPRQGSGQAGDASDRARTAFLFVGNTSITSMDCRSARATGSTAAGCSRILRRACTRASCRSCSRWRWPGARASGRCSNQSPPKNWTSRRPGDGGCASPWMAKCS